MGRRRPAYGFLVKLAAAQVVVAGLVIFLTESWRPRDALLARWLTAAAINGPLLLLVLAAWWRWWRRRAFRLGRERHERHLRTLRQTLLPGHPRNAPWT